MEEKYNCESNAAEQLEKLLSINSLARANTVNRNAWNSFEIGFLRILKRTHVFLHTMHNKFISFTRYCQIVKKSPYLFLKTKPTHLYTNQIRKVKFSHHVYFFKRIKRASSLVKLNEHVRRRRFEHALAFIGLRAPIFVARKLAAPTHRVNYKFLSNDATCGIIGSYWFNQSVIRIFSHCRKSTGGKESTRQIRGTNTRLAKRIPLNMHRWRNGSRRRCSPP